MKCGFPEDVKRIIEEILEAISKGKLAIFCGSGISMNSPSHLPSGKVLRKAIANQIINLNSINSEIKTSIETGIVQKEGMEIVFYPFEVFIQTIDQNAPFIQTLIKIFKKGKPNKNHIFLAELMKKRYVKHIMTTNFDTKIEDALKANNQWKKNIDFKIFFIETNFESIDLSKIELPVIFKIHGTIEDEESIRTTLNDISSSFFVKSRTNVIRHFFLSAEHDILIIGYSLSDEFDINPILRESYTKNKIYQIKHLSDPKELPKILPLEDPLNSFNGSIIKCNTNNIIEFLWKKLIEKKWKEQENNEDWKNILHEWSQKLSLPQKIFINAWIFLDLQEYLLAEKYFNQCLKIQKKTKDKDKIAIILHQLGGIELIKGNLNKSESFLNQSIDHATELSRIATSRHLLAIIQQKKGNFDKAKKIFEQNIKTFSELDDPPNIARSYHELANTLFQMKDYQWAEEFYNHSLKIKNIVGDLEGSARTLHMLAIIQLYKGKTHDAQILFQKNVETYKKLGKPLGIAISFYQLAIIHHLKKKYEEAEKLCKQCLYIFEKLGDEQNIEKAVKLLNLIQKDKIMKN